MAPSAVIVQARMSSTRLPGKVLEELSGRSVLSHVLSRCGAIEGIDVVCCAITRGGADDAVAAEAERCGVQVFRGSKDDVLDRYHQAAETLGAGVVMRVTSDCPLIDPAVCAGVLGLRSAEGLDYVSNIQERQWPRGLDCEVFTMETLNRAAEEARSPFEREHVTPWMRQHPSIRRGNYSGPGGSVAEQRWTLDYPEDLEFFRALAEKLPPPPAQPGWREIADVLADHPELVEINRHCRQVS